MTGATPQPSPLIDSPRAWGVCVAAALGIGTSFGTVYAFGAFFEPMADEFDTGLGPTALVFGITLLLFFGSGVITGPLGDRVGPRPLVIVGTLLLIGGLLATSQVQHVGFGYLTYGFGVGFGAGMFVSPLMASVGGWFQRYRAVAVGITATGSGLGTLVLVPASQRLIDAHGWRSAFVVLAVADGLALTIVAALVRPAPVAPPPPARERIAAVVRTRAFQGVAGSAAMLSVALFVPFGFLVTFATDQGVSQRAAAALISVIGASSIVGRLFLTSLSGRFGPVRVFQGCLAAQPFAYLVWLVAGDRYPLLLLFAAILGVAYGGFVAVSGEVLAHLFRVVGLGSVFGVIVAGFGIGGLSGPPLTGCVADSTGGQTVPIIIAVVVTTVATAISLTVQRSPVHELIVTG